MYSTVSKYETSFDIVTQIFAVDLDFVRCTVGSLKRSSCVGENMRATVNQLLNWFYQFKVNLFVHGAGRRLIQRDERLLALVSLSFGIGETNCSQGKIRTVSFKYLNFPKKGNQMKETGQEVQ